MEVRPINYAGSWRVRMGPSCTGSVADVNFELGPKSDSTSRIFLRVARRPFFLDASTSIQERRRLGCPSELGRPSTNDALASSCAGRKNTFPGIEQMAIIRTPPRVPSSPSPL